MKVFFKNRQSIFPAGEVLRLKPADLLGKRVQLTIIECGLICSGSPLIALSALEKSLTQYKRKKLIKLYCGKFQSLFQCFCT